MELLLPWIAGLGTALIMAVVFVGLAEDVWEQEIFAWDAPILLGVHALSRPWLDTAMLAITWTGQTGAGLAALGLAIGFAWQRRPWDAVAVTACLVSAFILNTLMKLLFTRPRPALFAPVLHVSGYSFPSGHAMAATAVYGFLAVWLWEHRRPLLAILSGLWVGLVAVSRIYLGAHYPSDTLAAMTFMALMVAVVTLLRGRFLRQQVLPTRVNEKRPVA